MSSPSMCSAEGFLAKTSPSPARGPGSTGRARVFGQSTPVWLASFDPDGLLWRTSQLCLDGELAVFSETWPRSGMTQSGTAFRLQPLVPLTAGTASGLLPTPEASNTKTRALRTAGRPPRDFLKPIPTPRPCSGLRSSGANRTEILRAVKSWPTPTSSDAAKGYSGSPGQANERGKQTLSGAVNSWPTPKASDALGSGQASRYEIEGRWNLRDAIPSRVGTGPLSPTWVEWLMGFPTGWTDLGDSATRSSRRSPSGSESES